MMRYPELAPNTKYYRLQEYIRTFKNKAEFEIEISYIEKKLGIILNNTCFRAPSAFWGNGGWQKNVQKKAWLSQGFEVYPTPIVHEGRREGVVKFRKLSRHH